MILADGRRDEPLHYVWRAPVGFGLSWKMYFSQAHSVHMQNGDRPGPVVMYRCTKAETCLALQMAVNVYSTKKAQKKKKKKKRGHSKHVGHQTIINLFFCLLNFFVCALRTMSILLVFCIRQPPYSIKMYKLHMMTQVSSSQISHLLNIKPLWNTIKET